MSSFNVAVIGAGVAGLTAAHELSERGFKVCVFDGEYDAMSRASLKYAVTGARAGEALSSRQPTVGGLAATQWYRIPSPWGNTRTRLKPLHPLTLASVVNLARPEDWWQVAPSERERRALEWEASEQRCPMVPFRDDSDVLSEFAQHRIGRVAARLAEMIEEDQSSESMVIRAPTFVGETQGIAGRRARAVAVELLAACRRRRLDVLVLEDGSLDRMKITRAGRRHAIAVRIAADAAAAEVDDPQRRRVEIEVSCADGTRWSEAPWTERPRPDAEELLLSPWEGRWPQLSFSRGSVALSAFVAWRVKLIAARLAAIIKRAHTSEYLVIGGVSSPDEAQDPGADPYALSAGRAEEVATVLLAACVALGFERGEPRGGDDVSTFLLQFPGIEHTVHVRVAGLGALHASELARKPEVQRYVEIRLLDRLLPGEHGYRFFPSFYHHIFDTMRRIPLLVPGKRDPFMAGYGLEIHRNVERTGLPGQRWEASARTVFDNLCSVDVHAFDSGGGGSVRAMERFKTRSLRGLLNMLETFQEHSDVPLRDIVLGQLKVVRYATSCAGRRAGYEAKTWADFAEASLGSAQYQRLLDHWPQALVGLQASRADARTTGTILLQLLLDQARTSGYRDGTLNAPTSEAWLDPWKRYLEHERGVEFVCARVDRFDFTDKGLRVAGVACDGETVIDGRAIPIDFDYVVIAASVDATAELGASLRAYLELERRDLLPAFERSPFHGVTALMPRGDTFQVAAGSEDPFEHFSGVQFYLQTDFAPLRGHVYYPNSPWRLSSVSQSQFRLERPGELEGYSGVISVVIGAFDEPGRMHKKSAWQCTAREIAEEVWDQITWSLQRSPGGAPPLPQYYAIDKNLVFSGPEQRLSRNLTPFLVNSADKSTAFPEQPGAYQVHMDRFVFAGTYLKTRTRLVTMEAANESARHAVNALIRHGRARSPARGEGLPANTGQECPIFDPEDRELEELELLRRIDAELLARGLPHWMDILAVEPQVKTLLDRGDGARGPGVTGALLAVLESAGGLGAEVLRMVRSHLIGRA